MKIDDLRCFAALAFACALSACAGSSSSDNAATADSATQSASTVAPASASPCHMPHGWNFDGACTTGYVTALGATFTLPSYRNLSATIEFGRNDATHKLGFIVGDATGDGDITGRLNGAMPFPAYGTVGCLGPRSTPAACPGKAALYLLVINASNAPVRFKTSPRIRLASLSGYPGTICELQTMVWSNARALEAVWRSHGWAAAVNGQIVTFPQIPAAQDVKSQGALTVYAVTCR